MIEVNFNLAGVNTLSLRLSEADRVVNNAIQQGVEDWTNWANDRAAKNLERHDAIDTGALLSSLTGLTSRRGDLSRGMVGPLTSVRRKDKRRAAAYPHVYGRFVDRGTRNIPARPFISPLAKSLPRMGKQAIERRVTAALARYR